MTNKLRTEKVFKGNVIITDIKTTGGKVATSEGIVNIIDEVEFNVLYKNMSFFVECYHVDEDHDTYCIRIYDNTEDMTIGDSTEICNCYLDSTGGGFADEIISITDKDNNHLEDVEQAIETFLFDNKEGVIIPF